MYMTIEEECENIINLPSNQLKEYLKDKKIRKRLLNLSGEAAFCYLIDNLKESDLLSLLDDDIIPSLKKSFNYKSKIISIMECKNQYKNVFLSKKEIVELIYEELIYMDYPFSILNINFGKVYFEYLISKRDLDSFRYLNGKVQFRILSENDNLDKIKRLNPNEDFLLSLSKESMQFLLEDNYFKNIFINMSINDIAYIVKKGVKLPNNLLDSNTLINKYLAIDNDIILLDYLCNLELNNPYLKEKILSKRKKQFNDIVEKEILEDNYFLEELIILYYEDIPYNFLKNTLSIIEYIAQIKEMIIPKNRLDLYYKLLKFYKLTYPEKIDLYNEIKENKNGISEFYDDFKTCFNDSIKKIQDSLLDVNKLTKSELSHKYNVDVYELNGEEFKILISHTNMNRDYLYEGEVWKKNKEYASLSLISDKCLNTFRNPSTNIIVGFTDINYLNVMHIHHADSYSKEENGSNRIIELFTPDNLIKNTKAYNEILIKNSNTLTPSYIVCYDEIKEGDVEASISLGRIPLILIHTKKYSSAKKMVTFDDDCYFSYEEASILVKKRRRYE